MEWAELTSFIVEAHGVGGSDSIPPYKQIEPVQDQGRLRSEQSIERVFYLSELDLLVLCEKPSPVVSIYSPKAFGCLHELKGHKAEVLAVVHIPEISCVVTSGADLALCWWDASGSSPSWRLRQRASLQFSQLALCWCACRMWLFSGGADGCVHAWDPIKLEVVHRLQGHEEAVTSIVLMKQRKELLATGSLDKCIRLWDVSMDPPRCCHTLGPPKVGLSPFGRHDGSASSDSDALRCHSRGVTCLAFSAAHRHLFSGGLDHELLVWNPLSERVICNLRQHTAPLTAVEAVDKSPIVVSADCSGVLCVWDCRSLSCAQRLVVQLPSDQIELSTMCLIPQHQQIVTAARRLACFQGPKEQDPFLTDSERIACGLYNHKSRTFCTAAGRSVIIWDATSGQMLRRYADITPTPITSVCFDDRERKLLVADHSGSVVVLNYQNGALRARRLEPARQLPRKKALLCELCSKLL